MNICEIIEKKKNKKELTEAEINFFVNDFTHDLIPDYQMSALLMAIVINGMTEEETYYLTKAMIDSGDTMSYEDVKGVIVDKHSTGGIGDKTTLVIVPIVASLGCKVAKMSGKGLGFTGGTADKLESISGYNISLSSKDFIDSLNRIGAVMVYQTGNIAPADKKIYALRDVTGTVESIPLIASSIMSKKIALGAHVIVLDVKYGSGAFMKNKEDATLLANTMVSLGKRFNRKVVALITNMNIPLGTSVGNKLEVQEAVKILNNEENNELKELCISLATEMVSQSLDISTEESKSLVIDAINSKKAFNKFKEIVENQGGDFQSILTPCKAKTIEVTSEKAGYINRIISEKVGMVASLVGSGRITKDDIIDYETGVFIEKTVGDYVTVGERIATIYLNDLSKSEEAREKYLEAITISNDKPLEEPLIYKIVR